MLKPKAQKEIQKGFLSATYNTKSKFSIRKLFVRLKQNTITTIGFRGGSLRNQQIKSPICKMLSQQS